VIPGDRGPPPASTPRCSPPPPLQPPSPGRHPPHRLFAATHAYAALDWYFHFTARPTGFEMLLRGNTSLPANARFSRSRSFGIFALLVMLLLAATSHDFLGCAFLTPPVWEGAAHDALHGPRYAGGLSHISSLGALQGIGQFRLLGRGDHGFAPVGVATPARGPPSRPPPPPEASQIDGWLDAGLAAAIEEDHGIVVTPAGRRADQRVFFPPRPGRLSAVSNPLRAIKTDRWARAG